MPRKQTQEEFISKALKLYKNKYDYSKVEYKHSLQKVVIICPIHGEFLQTPSSHLKSGCPLCGREKGNTRKTKTNEQFINECKSKFGDLYDYSKVHYINARTKILIGCKIHGFYEVTPISFINNKGCKYCSYDKLHENYKSSREEFIAKAKTIHKDKYDYSKVIYYNNATLVTIICNKHGDFKQTPLDHIKGTGCPKCNLSKNEILITDYLMNLGFVEDKDFYRQYVFNNCINYKTNRKLKFDFIFLLKIYALNMMENNTLNLLSFLVELIDLILFKN